ncbi:MAG TPA: multicopper oxidase, partial [Myxococcaceae bacterium]|nr:multicopper oxidase [Myxococcaceae bacterium]
TTVWGFGRQGQPVSYPGPTLVARRDVTSFVQWHNSLPRYARPPSKAHLLPVDTTIHLAMPSPEPPVGVPVVTHLHGGHTESASDGLPEAWFTQDYEEVGPQFVKKVYRYDNTQEAATLWYHDHVLGRTRLNVYAGLAGAYFLHDANEELLVAREVLPHEPYEEVLVIQDRLFTEQGALFYPAEPPPGSTAPFPSVRPTFFGNFILVNGMTWPRLDVEPRQYRFRLINGSDSRFYRLFFDRNMRGRVFQVATDTGLQNHPVPLDEPFVISPGERRELVIDFEGLSGARLTLKNDAPAPFPYGKTPDADDPTHDIMRLDVRLPLDARVPRSDVRAALPGGRVGTLRPLYGPIEPLHPVRRRRLLLFQGMDAFKRPWLLLGAELRPDVLETLLWDDPITENPGLGDVETWELYNLTGDTHPIHIHLVSFQVLGRAPILDFPQQAFRTKAMVEPHTGELRGTGATADLTKLPVGSFRPPPPEEQGWKDTVQAHPGEVTRVIARYDRPGRYAWHCHILSHEDHEMMRPYFVGPRRV